MGRKGKLPEGLKAYIWVVIGSILAAAAINTFLVPYRIAPGGVTGLATVIHYLSGSKLPVGAVMLVFNIPLFFLGLKLIGGKFAVRTLFGTVFLSAVIDVTEPFLMFFVENYLQKPQNSPASPDVLLYSVFGGALMGAGLGLVLRSGATTGGTDLAARVLHRFIPSLSIGQILLLIDGVVVLFAAAAFKSFILALYAIVAIYISSKVIDSMLEGVNFSKALLIISDKWSEIADRILNDLDRGVTGIKGTGLYTGDEKNMLLCVVHRRQIPALKAIVKSIDEKAFVIVADIREVLGEGFKTYT